MDTPLSIYVLVDALGWEVVRNRSFLDDVLLDRRWLTTILGYSMAFNNPVDAFHGPKSGVTVFQIQANGSYKEVYAAG